MSNNVQEICLSRQGIEYLRNRLADGFTLAREVAKRLPEFRRVFTLRPPNANLDLLEHLEAGGILPSSNPGHTSDCVEIPSTLEGLSLWIVERLRKSPSAALVLENALAEPEAPYLTSARHIMIYGREVYHSVHTGSDVQTVKETIRVATSVLDVFAIITSMPAHAVRPKDTERTALSAEALSQLASAAEVIIVGAYDGERYIIAEH